MQSILDVSDNYDHHNNETSLHGNVYRIFKAIGMYRIFKAIGHDITGTLRQGVGVLYKL